MLQETTQHRQQQEALFNDFYSEYQDLNYPVLRPVVIDATNRILRQYPQIAQLNAEQFRAVWPKLKSAIGTTARGLVSQIRGAGSPALQTVATSQATVPGGGGGGASPPRLPVTLDIHDEVNSWR